MIFLCYLKLFIWMEFECQENSKRNCHSSLVLLHMKISTQLVACLFKHFDLLWERIPLWTFATKQQNLLPLMALKYASTSKQWSLVFDSRNYFNAWTFQGRFYILQILFLEKYILRICLFVCNIFMYLSRGCSNKLFLYLKTVFISQ